jgi:hypothetical protein
MQLERPLPIPPNLFLKLSRIPTIHPSSSSETGCLSVEAEKRACPLAPLPRLASSARATISRRIVSAIDPLEEQRGNRRNRGAFSDRLREEGKWIPTRRERELPLSCRKRGFEDLEYPSAPLVTQRPPQGARDRQTR